ncbi:MAG: methionine--tRNA ligase subunit beta, partial [Desulfovibrionaceae bacterium]|nr:methionine--tRNA ligase subunit beta [Desulfovibrionaceae bacterium]
GNVIDPVKLAGICGMDSFRYYLLREMHFGSDASFSLESLIVRHNADLANDLGNLFSRVLAMNQKYFEGKVPQPAQLLDEDRAIIDLAADAQERYLELFGQTKFSYALEALWELVRAMNKYVDSTAPWTLFKESNTERLSTVMHTLLTGLFKVAVQLLPVMPESAGRMLEQLNKDPRPERYNLNELAKDFCGMIPGEQLSKGSNLFPRLEESAFNSLKPRASKPKTDATRPAPTGEAQASAEPETVSYNDFAKIDLRVGTIVAAEKHPNADKLFRLEIDLGEEKPRQILSGLAEYFTPDELVGRQVCVVANLAPREMRGLVSHGMLLASHKGENELELLAPCAPVPPGSKVY